MDYIFNIILIFFLTIIIAYLFGFTLVHLIDKRLDKLTNTESFNNKLDPVVSKTYNFQTGEVIKGKYDNDYYKTKKKDSLIEGYSSDTFKEWYIDKKKTHVCIKQHKHEKDGSNGLCTYGVTNYADPIDMSHMDLKIFNLNYPPNMTLQDYINWLYCYVDKEDELPYNHLKNLEKLKAGIELITEEGVLPPPAYYYPALNAKDYFDKMYNDSDEFNIASPLNSTTGPMIGYNYDEYSEFSQNMDVNGTTGVLLNNDIAKKKDAKKLFNYIVPKDSNSINIENDYEKYHIKNVEI